MAADPYHSYSNEAERANEDIYDDFNLKKIIFCLHRLYKNISAILCWMETYMMSVKCYHDIYYSWYNVSIDSYVWPPVDIYSDRCYT